MTTLALAEQHRCRRLKEACLKFLERPANLNKVTIDGCPLSLCSQRSHRQASYTLK
jgi:hypothetical protein